MFQLVPNSLLDSICMVAVVLVALYNYWCMKNNHKGTGYLFFVVFILLFSLLYRPEGGDFWHHLEVYELGSAHHNNLEDFYNWLMDKIPNNFLLWRIVIWFPAAIFIMLTYKMMGVGSNNATTFFLMFGLISVYYYTRNVLASSILYLGMAICCVTTKPLKRFFSIVIFVGLSVVSYFLHKSMPMYIGLALMAIILPLNRNTVIGALIAFPLLYGLIYALSANILQMELWLTDEVGLNYLEGTNTFTTNWKGVVNMIVKYIPFVYFYFIAFKNPIPKESEDYKFYKTFLLLGFLIFYLSFLFMGQGSIAIQGRLYKSSMIPFAFAVSLFFKHNLGSKQCRAFLVLMLVYYAYTLFVSTATSL